MNLSSRAILNLSIGSLTAIIIGLCLLVWGLNLNGRPGIYDIFPVLGLLAFSLMAMHYIGGSLKRSLGLEGDERALATYVKVTGYVVLCLILLHPGLLYFGLWQDGLGLPPLSTWEVYPQAAARAALVMGSVSLTAFLLFELHRWFRERSWWKYIEYASVAAMLLIFVHSLMLGGELMTGWFRLVWIVFGWALAFCITYNYWFDHTKKGENV